MISAEIKLLRHDVLVCRIPRFNKFASNVESLSQIVNSIVLFNFTYQYVLKKAKF